MNVLVVYDSVFGNTEKIALAIGQGLSEVLSLHAKVETLPVGQVTPEALSGLGWLVVGSPTRSFRPTEAAAAFLNALPQDALAGVRVAAFDTRIDLVTIQSSALRFIVNKGGYAAAAIAKALKKKGGRLAAPPAGFLVTGEQGPLKDGELERAREWAAGLAAKD